MKAAPPTYFDAELLSISSNRRQLSNFRRRDPHLCVPAKATNSLTSSHATPDVDQIIRETGISGRFLKSGGAGRYILEFRNCAITSEHVVGRMISKKIVTKEDILNAHSMLFRGVPAIELWSQVRPGKYRTGAVSSQGRLINVYPYHLEVPANMKLWVSVFDRYVATLDGRRELHPVVLRALR